MPAPNDNITKDPAAAGRKGGLNKRGKKHTFTKIKEKLELQGISWENAEQIVEANMLDFLNSGNKKERFYATRFFSEYIKPKKKEMSGNVTMTFEDYLAKTKEE
jgi:hypothetical protein